LKNYQLAYFLKLPACLALVATIYWSGLSGSFFFDDGPNILGKPGVALQAVSWGALADLWQSGGAGPLGRPVAQISFALNHYFSGFDPFFFKLTNLVIHLVNGLLILALASLLLPVVERYRQVSAVLPLLVMTVWLLHPIQLLAVLHVSQRMTSLSALFLLAALLCHIQGRRSSRGAGFGWLLCGWLLLWPLAIYSKESGLLLPLFAAAWEIFIRPRQVGGIDRLGRSFLGLVAAAILIAMVYGFTAEGQWLWRGYAFRAFSMGERLLTECRVVFLYLGQIFFPRFEVFGLFHDDLVISRSLLTPWTTLPSVFGILLVSWLTWYWRRRCPLAAFGICWFLVGHLLESTALPLELMHEHRNYLPLFGIVLAVALGLSKLLDRIPAQRTLILVLSGACVAYLGFVTALRSHQFADEFRRTQLEAQHHRNSARAQNDAGSLLLKYAAVDGRHSPTYGLARAHFELANSIDPNMKFSLLGLLLLNCQVGLPVDSTWIEELGKRLQFTPMAPGDRNVLYSLRELQIERRLCLERGEVERLFTAAADNVTANQGVRAMFNSWLADYLWLGERDMVSAIKALDLALVMSPGNPSYMLKLAQLYFLSGERHLSRNLLTAVAASSLPADERQTHAELLSALTSLEEAQ